MEELTIPDQTELEKVSEGVNLNLGDSFFKCKSSLIKFKEKINELKSSNSKLYSENYIHEYFSNLRNEIDLDREEVKESIDNHYLKVINDIEKFEKECKAKLNDYKYEEIMKDVGNFEEKFKEFKGCLDVLEINVQKWDTVRGESEDHIMKLKKKTRNLQNELLLNKSHVFKSSKISLRDDIKSVEIVTKKVEVKEYDRHGFFNFTINNFLELNESNPGSVIFCSKNFIMNDNEWFVQVCNEDIGHLACYLHRDRKNDENENDISTKFKVQLFNKVPSKNKAVEFAWKFGPKSWGYGWPDFISYKDLFNEGFYDIINDTINISVYIEYLDV